MMDALLHVFVPILMFIVIQVVKIPYGKRKRPAELYQYLLTEFAAINGTILIPLIYVYITKAAYPPIFFIYLVYSMVLYTVAGRPIKKTRMLAKIAIGCIMTVLGFGFYLYGFDLIIVNNYFVLDTLLIVIGVIISLCAPLLEFGFIFRSNVKASSTES